MLFRLLYNTILVPLWPVYRLLSLFVPAVRRFFLSRRQGRRELLQFAAQNRGNPEPPIWLHGSSVGEIDQALGVAREIRRRKPKIPIVLTAFSLSVRLRPIDGVDLFTYIPFDFPWAWGQILKTLRPRAFVTMTWDVFPNLLHRCLALGVPAFLSSASLAPNNRRLRWPWRSLVRPLYSGLAGIGVVNDENAPLFQSLTAHPEHVSVTGDSRYDTILYRLATARPDPEDQKRLQASGRPCLVLASTYAGDDAELLPGLPALLARFPEWKVWIFPHKIDAGRIEQLGKSLEHHAIGYRRLSEAGDGSERVLVVDCLGLLAFAYAHTDIAYVGGAFHHRVHNTAEPAALGVPIVTGPAIDWSGIALELESLGSLYRSRSGEQALNQIARWMADATERRAAGERGRHHLEKSAGASARFYETFLQGLAG
ncbi:MAG: hypothetical protein H7A21_15830 [Spirochaetales bacterium]|nr:hypothetical protein [Leptospiraceae bacterium]MCP5482907.1 hypothetical protein [Spirochaetales bacterium]MCP5486972.1 hypothetical protein [Spirochaetales bacterium]